jgi:ribosome-associated protein
MRLTKLAGKRVTQDGILIIEAKRYRTQESNRADAIRRFYKLVQQALEKPKTRKKTRPTRASQEKRLLSKKIRSKIKQHRREKLPPE